MVTLIESVEIAVPLNELYGWLLKLDRNFVKWSPCHRRFQTVTGGFAVGDKVRFRERVQRVNYRIGGIIRCHEKNENGFRIMFETMSGLSHIYFIGGRSGSGCSFTHIEEFGLPNTRKGKFVNRLLFDILAKRRANWRLIQEDMARDNVYLKQILETGVYPERENAGRRSLRRPPNAAKSATVCAKF